MITEEMLKIALEKIDELNKRLDAIENQLENMDSNPFDVDTLRKDTIFARQKARRIKRRLENRQYRLYGQSG